MNFPHNIVNASFVDISDILIYLIQYENREFDDETLKLIEMSYLHIF